MKIKIIKSILFIITILLLLGCASQDKQEVAIVDERVKDNSDRETSTITNDATHIQKNNESIIMLIDRYIDDKSQFDFQEVTRLLENGADTRVVNTSGWTLLMVGSDMGNTEFVQHMINEQVDLDARNNDGVHALGLALVQGQLDVVRLLLTSGANIDNQDMDGNTVLMSAVEDNNIELVQYFIEQGANVNHKSHEGKTAMHIATKNNRIKIMKTLVMSGADVRVTMNNGITPLLYAVEKGRLEAVEFLLMSGASPRDAYIREDGTRGDTAVMIARKNGYYEIGLLLSAYM